MLARALCLAKERLQVQSTDTMRGMQTYRGSSHALLTIARQVRPWQRRAAPRAPRPRAPAPPRPRAPRVQT